MKECSVENCERKHHAKGMCKPHYTRQHEKKRAEQITCSIDGCDKKVYYLHIAKGLCPMHFGRVKRYGDVNFRHRERDTKSIISLLLDSENPLEFEMDNQETFSVVCKIYYGDKCMHCGWDEATCDAHHRQPKSKGGKNTIANGIILCPNCHRKEHGYKGTTKHKLSEEVKELIKELGGE
jgi:hypothetical protein